MKKSSSEDQVETDLASAFQHYAAAPESTRQISLREQYGLYIDGKFSKPQSGEWMDTVNPATESVLASVAVAGESDVDRAVQAAKKAQKKWQNIPPRERGKVLYRLARLIQERSRELSVIESMDGGKPIRESRDVDIPLVAAWFFYYAGWADKLSYAFPGREAEPVGVCGQIIPWNFPLLMLAWKIAPALAAGNTVVLKPAETTSLTALVFADICRDADVPPGVINIVTGAASTGQALVHHPDIKKIAFTGSTAVGRWIQKAIAGSDKKYSLELGGKGANIIFEDAPIEQAVEGVINAIFFNQGHVCCAGARLLVQESISETFLQKLKHRMSHLIVGDPLDKNTDIGAINSASQLQRIREYIDIGLTEGAQLYQSHESVPSTGYFCSPMLFTDVSQSHTIVQEEIFGPVLTVQTFRTPTEALEKANNTPYGLSGGVWTDKGSKIFQAGSEIRAGVLWSNTFNKFDPTSPFGGYKESGVGREGGLHGLYPYIHLR